MYSRPERKCSLFRDLAALTGALLIFGCGPTPPADAPESQAQPVPIGVLAPLTGEVATYGQAILNGIELAAQELNANATKFSLRVEDTAANPRVGVTAAQKLLSADRVPAIIGAVASSVTLSVAPIAEANGVVLLSPASSSPKISSAGDYIFRNYPSDTFEGSAAAEFALSRGWKTASTIVLNNDYGTGLQKVFEAQFRGGAGKIASSDLYNEGTADFRATLIRIRGEAPDVLFMVGYGKELGTIARQARELGVESQLLSTVNFHDEQTLLAGGAAIEGAVYTSPAFDPESEDAAVRSFVSSYRERFGSEPDVWSAHGYDAMRLVAKACLESSACSSDEIRDALYAIRDWPGVSGVTSFDENGDVTKTLRFMTVRDGKFTPLEG